MKQIFCLGNKVYICDSTNWLTSSTKEQAYNLAASRITRFAYLVAESDSQDEEFISTKNRYDGSEKIFNTRQSVLGYYQAHSGESPIMIHDIQSLNVFMDIGYQIVGADRQQFWNDFQNRRSRTNGSF